MNQKTFIGGSCLAGLSAIQLVRDRAAKRRTIRARAINQSMPVSMNHLSDAHFAHERFI
jgi:hypothetical protein